MKVLHGVLYRRFFNDNGESGHLQLIVPSSLKDQVCRHFHDIPTGGHLGTEKTLDKVRNSLYWPKMKRDIERYCSQCDLCAAKKPSKTSNKAPLQQYLVGKPMERVAVDVLGPLPLTVKGNKYILVLCDCFSKWTEAFAMPDQEYLTITKILVNESICRYGTPLQFHSDQGRSFEAKLFRDMLSMFRIEKPAPISQWYS